MAKWILQSTSSGLRDSLVGLAMAFVAMGGLAGAALVGLTLGGVIGLLLGGWALPAQVGAGTG